jgi:hypothetical protein
MRRLLVVFLLSVAVALAGSCGEARPSPTAPVVKAIADRRAQPRLADAARSRHVR